MFFLDMRSDNSKIDIISTISTFLFRVYRTLGLNNKKLTQKNGSKILQMEINCKKKLFSVYLFCGKNSNRFSCFYSIDTQGNPHTCFGRILLDFKTKPWQNDTLPPKMTPEMTPKYDPKK